MGRSVLVSRREPGGSGNGIRPGPCSGGSVRNLIVTKEPRLGRHWAPNHGLPAGSGSGASGLSVRSGRSGATGAPLSLLLLVVTRSDADRCAAEPLGWVFLYERTYRLYVKRNAERPNGKFSPQATYAYLPKVGKGARPAGSFARRTSCL